MSGIWHRCGVLYLFRWKRFESNVSPQLRLLMCPVIWILNSLGMGMFVFKTRSGRLDSAISDNLLLHTISVSDCSRPWQGFLVVQINFLQNNLFIFNLLSACLHSHTPTTHTTKKTPQSLRYPPPYSILLLFSLYFCGIRQYFLQILSVSAYI